MIAGVDEAGRGPLAGPVVASSVILKHSINGLNDSKSLSAAKREKLFFEITHQSLAWSYAVASAHEIDNINILQATKLAMVRSVMILKVVPEKVEIDGRDTIDIPYPCEAIVKGDQLKEHIMAASIIAKTVRDRMMAMMAVHYPVYGFERHSGYPTSFHRQQIALHGCCIHHRKSFRK